MEKSNVTPLVPKDKNLNDKKWRKYNDSHVSDPVTQKEVLSQRPYCLFYTRNK